MRLVRAAAPVCATVLFLSVASPASARSPIQPDNRPTPLPGQRNGEVDPALLVRVEGSCRVARAAGPSLVHLFTIARGQGVALDPEDCYREVARQRQDSQSACASGNCACAASVSSTTSTSSGGTSMHGWGKAVDFSDNGQGMDFGSPGYAWLKANAARFGWNHPGWAEPGGSACPEAWHWEWVGDGGTQGDDPIVSDRVAGFIDITGDGLTIVTGLGGVTTRGDAINAGGIDNRPVAAVIVGAAPTPMSQGYWLVGADGGVFSLGDAEFFGSTGGIRLNAPVVGMAATPDGGGYWLVASDGGIFAFGDAGFHGSLGAIRLNRPIVGMAATPSGEGYWLVASDGGIFALGDAAFYGSTGDIALNAPIVGIAATPDGGGYWLVAADGGVFAFGDARPLGSTGANPPRAPVIGMAASPSGMGYDILAADGAVYPFGDAFH